ncbi:MAG: hypothetical protein ACLVHV_15590 [Oscillospiraceae bacterium]
MANTGTLPRRSGAEKKQGKYPFSDLPVEAMEQLAVCDSYFTEDKTFCVLNYSIYIDHDELAEAIAHLPDEKRDYSAIVLFGTVGQRDRQAAEHGTQFRCLSPGKHFEAAEKADGRGCK